MVGAGFQQGVYRDQSCTLIQHVERLLSNVAVQSKISMKRCGLNSREMNAIRLTLAAYNRANPMNALSLQRSLFSAFSSIAAIRGEDADHRGRDPHRLAANKRVARSRP